LTVALTVALDSAALLAEPVVAVGALGAATADPIDMTEIAIAPQAIVAASTAARSFRMLPPVRLTVYLQQATTGLVASEHSSV
jgi:hypothetical protein